MRLAPIGCVQQPLDEDRRSHESVNERGTNRGKGKGEDGRKRRKKKRHLCLAKLGVARGARGADPVDEGFWRLNKHVITDCLQLATLYLPTKVTIHPLPLCWIHHLLPGWFSRQQRARKRKTDGEGAEAANRGLQAQLRGTPSSRDADETGFLGLRAILGTPSTCGSQVRWKWANGIF